MNHTCICSQSKSNGYQYVWLKIGAEKGNLRRFSSLGQKVHRWRRCWSFGSWAHANSGCNCKVPWTILLLLNVVHEYLEVQNLGRFRPSILVGFPSFNGTIDSPAMGFESSSTQMLFSTFGAAPHDVAPNEPEEKKDGSDSLDLIQQGGGFLRATPSHPSTWPGKVIVCYWTLQIDAWFT